MSKMNISAILIPVYIISILLIVGCASTSRPEYVGKTMFIPLKSSPEGARVLLDGRQQGNTPMTLKFTYLIDSHGPYSDETEERIVKIEKEGYEPYVLSFPTKGKEYETMPSLILIKKLDDVIKAEDSLNKDQENIRELKESRKKAKEALDEIERLRKEIALLKEKKETQEIIHEPIEVLSATDRIEKELEPEKDIVPDKEHKNDDNANNSYKKTMADDQYASQGIYTIQTGSFLEIELAQKQFDSVVQVLNAKEVDYIRIEKVGNYYTVRLGKFLDYASVEGFLQDIKPQLSEAVILKAHIKNERLIRLYE
jgi:hypothetical protein